MLTTSRFTYAGETITLTLHEYADGRQGCVATDSVGLPYATASINLNLPNWAKDFLPERAFWLKDYSENRDLIAAAIRQGAIQVLDNIPPVAMGYTLVHAACLAEPWD